MKIYKLILPLLVSLPFIGGIQSSQVHADSNNLDLEFNSSSSINDFASEGTISYVHNSAMLVDGGPNLSITSPILSMESGNKYSALLPSRNTIFVRLKNTSDATKVKVSFITNYKEAYSDSQSKEFDIEPNSDYKSYFFNLSDKRTFTNADLANGEYLKQFKLSFDNTTSGSVEIEAFSFEREDAIVRYVGKIDSCLADKEAGSVSIKGKVNSLYKNKTVTVLQSDAQNYDDRLNYTNSIVLAEVTPDEEGNFVATFDLMKNEQTTHLSSKFIVLCDGKRVDKTTMISNIEDFSIIKERFSVPETVFNVLDFGAKGDAFTNDTKAIQDTINAASNAGGGVVLIPGDTSTQYGRRYMMTHIEVKSNVELRIEEGAVLWQSPRQEEYHYAVPGYEQYEKPVFGHDLDIHGIMWCHACATVNLPFIYVDSSENVRITGGGQIRMMDPGVEVEDAQLFLGDPSTNKGCQNIMHLCPIYSFNVTNYDVKDIEIHKASGWHCTSSHSENVWYSNIIEYDTCCVTSDGMSFGSVHGGVMERCMSYTSDDGLVISSSYNDDRRFLFANPKLIENIDNSCSDIYCAHNFAWGGFGNSYIPWGSSNPDFENVGIHDVEMNDNVFGGQKSVGVWNDDPFYGYSKYGTYNSCEDNDYAPMYNLHFHNNTYLNGFQMYLNGNRMPITNLLVEDNDEYSSKAVSSFQHGNFDKNVRIGPMYEDETNWTVGLSNWSREGDASFGTEKVKEGLGYSGYIQGNGRLYQGLYEMQGYYRLNMKIYSKGTSYIFVQDRLTKQYLIKEKVNNSDDFVDKELYFNNIDERLLLIGVIHEGEEKVYLDDCKILRVEDAKFMDAYALETFENSDVLLVDNPYVVSAGENKVLGLSDSLTTLSAQYKTMDIGLDFVTTVDEEQLSVVLSNGHDSATYSVELNNYNDRFTHYLGIRINEQSISFYIDYVLVNEIARTDGLDTFTIGFASSNEMLVDNLLVAMLDSVTLEKTIANISFDNAENYDIQQVGQEKFVGETYSFRVNTNDDIEVFANEVLLEKVGDVYSFTLTNENTIKVVKKVAPIDPDDPITPDDPVQPVEPKKGCRGSIESTSLIFVTLSLASIVLILLISNKNNKGKGIKKVTLPLALFTVIGSLTLAKNETNVKAVGEQYDTGVDNVLVNRVINGGEDVISFGEDEVINSGNTPGTWTEFVWGSQNNGTVETVSFDITCHYASAANGILTLQLNRWDAAQLYKVEITQSHMKWTRWGWSDEAGTGVPVETLGEVGFGLKDGVTYHIDYIRKSWDKMLFINNTKVFYVCQGDLTVGCLGIESWELGYEMENIKRRDGYDNDLWNMSTLDSYKDGLVSKLNGEINKISDPTVRTEAGKYISKFVADLNKVYLKDDMDALYEQYKVIIAELNVEDINNMSKMKKIYTSLEYVGASDPSKYNFTKFDTIYLPIENNNESAVSYADQNYVDNYVASVEFAPQILNYWTISEFRFNYVDSQNYYAMRMTDHSVEFIQVSNGATVQTFASSSESSQFKTYRYTVEYSGTSLKLFVNGELMIQDEVTNASNKICFWIWNGGMCISDITYYSYETLQVGLDYVLNYEYGSDELKAKYISFMHKATCEAKVKVLMYEFKSIADQTK